MNEENDLIDLVFTLENGYKFDVKVEKSEKLLTVIEKIVEKEEGYNNLENILIFDENNDITDRVKNGEIISSFEFNRENIIQIKLKD